MARGYLTHYELSIEPKVAAPALLLCPVDGGNRTLAEVTEGDPYKWYEHEADMRRISAERPGVLFTLDGSGEDAGDVWRKYFWNGLMQEWRPHLQPDPFDPNKLR